MIEKNKELLSGENHSLITLVSKMLHCAVGSENLTVCEQHNQGQTSQGQLKTTWKSHHIVKRIKTNILNRNQLRCIAGLFAFCFKFTAPEYIIRLFLLLLTQHHPQ
ncbi:hypothetical protein GQX74_005542 [Glossina fuscipes]|nr:hypothetical protein GQX74_005542 [Glossina fuscipes]